MRAVGESDVSAHSIGYDVIKVRYLAVLFGGVMAGLGGAFLSLSYTPMWAEEMTAGRGWIALALVVFASWRPWRLFLGAYLFLLLLTALTLYIMAGFSRHEELLSRLGKFKTGKSCLYVKRLDDVDQKILAQLIRASVVHMRKTYPTT